MRFLRRGILLLALGFGCASPPSGESSYTPAPGHWPQWRGPKRDNVSAEIGLLKEWPEGGPKLLWKTTGLGESMAPVSVAGGLIFTLGYREDKEFVTALDGVGRLVWSQLIGPAQREFPGMRFTQQRMPTVDDEHLYTVTAAGTLLCLRTADGQIVWEKDYVRDFGGRTTGWKFGDRPLVEGKLLICTPGGHQGTVRALNKLTGESVWQCAELKDSAQYSALLPVEIGGVRQCIVFTLESVAGIAVRDGKLLWRVERQGSTVVAPTPLHKDGLVFVTSGHGRGCNAFQVTLTDGQFRVQEIYAGKQMQNYHGGVILVGDHVYGTSNARLTCLELRSGKVVWEDRCVGQGAAAYADGLLVVRSEKGPVALVEATPAGYKEKGRFNQPDRTTETTVSHPIIAGGRLYLRDLDTLFCYDLRSADYKDPEIVWNILARVPAKPPTPQLPLARPGSGLQPDAIFVATPQDVVEKMIEAAKITKDDLVYDLGSGDGRIVIAASKRHGCKSVGFEIDSDLVRESRRMATEAKLDELVTIEQRDLFTVDLTSASVVTLYLGAPNNAKLLPQLRKLKPGSRIVSHAHLLGEHGPQPDVTLKVMSKDDQSEHLLYLWTTPLKEPPPEKGK